MIIKNETKVMPDQGNKDQIHESIDPTKVISTDSDSTEINRPDQHINSSRSDIYSIENDYNTFCITAPLNSLNDLALAVSKSDDSTLVLYVRVSNIKISTDYTLQVIDDEGDTVSMTDPLMMTGYVRIGTISRDQNRTWSIRLDDRLPVQLVDINMYSRCWSTHDNRSIRDFINDILLRILQVGKYSPTASTNLDLLSVKKDNGLMTNESIMNTEDDLDQVDTTQYEIEYNPDEVIVYIHENIDDDPTLDESDEDRDEKIRSFFESVFESDDSEVIQLSENLSKIIINVGASYLLGKGALALLKPITKSIRRNPYTDKNTK